MNQLIKSKTSLKLRKEPFSLEPQNSSSSMAVNSSERKLVPLSGHELVLHFPVTKILSAASLPNLRWEKNQTTKCKYCNFFAKISCQDLDTLVVLIVCQNCAPSLQSRDDIVPPVLEGGTFSRRARDGEHGVQTDGGNNRLILNVL